MAEHKIQGGDYLLNINDDTVVCLTSVGISDSVAVVDASSACGPDKSPGSLEISISFEGQHLQDPTTGKISGTDLRTLLRNEATINFNIAPMLPKMGDEVQIGTGFISELSSTYSFDSVGTFTGTIQCYGMPTTQVLTFDIGQLVGGGYVCYKDEENGFCLVASPVGEVNTQNSLDKYDWGAVAIITGANGTGFTDGYDNTFLIVDSDNSPDIAAAMCEAKGPGWYLPAVDELINGVGAHTALMPFLDQITTPSKQPYYFWTSTEFDGLYAKRAAQVMTSSPTTFVTTAQDLKGNKNFVIAYKYININ